MSLVVVTAPTVEPLTVDEVQAWCRDGSIIDCKTLVGTLWLQNVLAGAWSLDWSGAMPANVAR